MVWSHQRHDITSPNNSLVKIFHGAPFTSFFNICRLKQQRQPTYHVKQKAIYDRLTKSHHGYRKQYSKSETIIEHQNRTICAENDDNWCRPPHAQTNEKQVAQNSRNKRLNRVTGNGKFTNLRFFQRVLQDQVWWCNSPSFLCNSLQRIQLMRIIVIQTIFFTKTG